MVGSLPRTALNKVLRARLRQELAGSHPGVRGQAPQHTEGGRR
jgi:acyl-coenzyme A synthetase/AMP-(fatty) acid ligase